MVAARCWDLERAARKRADPERCRAGHCVRVAVLTPGHLTDRRQTEPCKITVWGGAGAPSHATRAKRAPLTVILQGSRLERQEDGPAERGPVPRRTARRERGRPVREVCWREAARRAPQVQRRSGRNAVTVQVLRTRLSGNVASHQSHAGPRFRAERSCQLRAARSARLLKTYRCFSQTATQIACPPSVDARQASAS